MKRFKMKRTKTRAVCFQEETEKLLKLHTDNMPGHTSISAIANEAMFCHLSYLRAQYPWLFGDKINRQNITYEDFMKTHPELRERR